MSPWDAAPVLKNHGPFTGQLAKGIAWVIGN